MVRTDTAKTEKAARQAAQRYDLDAEQFANFWNDRFGHYAPGYMQEWAERIAHGRAEFVADDTTLDALHRAGYTGRA